MSKAQVLPDLNDLFNDFKDEIFDDLNCIQIGKINSFDKTAQTATILIQMKYARTENDLVDYPMLVDCPVIFLQGGGAFMDFPIATGDYCLVFFNDKDIDNWWSTANVKEPNSLRKHSLSDGFALVGINPKTKVLAIDGTNLGVVCNSKKFYISGATEIDFLAATEAYIKGNTLYTQLNTLIMAMQTFTSGLTTTTLAAQAGVMNTACTTALGILSQIKSTKIFGE